MLGLVVTLHLLGLSAVDRARTTFTDESQRGSVTIEKVLWAVAAIAIAGIVVTAVTTFVETESGKIK